MNTNGELSVNYPQKTYARLPMHYCNVPIVPARGIVPGTRSHGTPI